MFEKVNPAHPDKVADRIAGAIVDLAYAQDKNAKAAIEVLIGHNHCSIVGETSCSFDRNEIISVIKRIAPDINDVYINLTKQDVHLANNQSGIVKCGDNGIFKGVPITEEQKALSMMAYHLYEMYPTDGKYILDDTQLIICQSHAETEDIRSRYPYAIINPLGDWTGGLDVDSGATNRKLGSDMGDSVTGGGLHGKDLSKADVSVNIYAWLKAQETGEVQKFCCAIGDETIDGKPYAEIVQIAKNYIDSIGGFEKFAEWGLI